MPSFSRVATIPSTAEDPTFFTTPMPKRIASEPSWRRSTVKLSKLVLRSGGSTSMPSFEHSATAAAMRAWVSGALFES